MAPPPPLKRLSSTSSLHTTQTPRLSLSTTNPNVFSDENALEPSALTPDSALSPTADNRALESPSYPSQPAAGPVHRQFGLIEDQSHQRRSVGENELSIGLRREGSSARKPHHPPAAAAGSLSDTSKDSTSNSSAFVMPQTQNPYHGATGPSHPYAMYPQDIGVSRTSSLATNPGARLAERTNPAVGGPTQPYGLYPQNTVPEDDVILGAGGVQSVLGFPGRQRTYQRRFGPDPDEAADIIGPDGYTEQLPAYTRYANDIPPKPMNPRRGEPHNQPGESRDTLNTITSEDSDPRSPAVGDSSTRLRAPAAGVTTVASPVTGSPSEINPSSAPTSSEGGHFKELVKDRGKKRVCCGKLPMWLCTVFLVVGACVVGGLIGGILGNAKATSEDARLPYRRGANFSLPTVTATVTATLVDAEPISTPSGLPTPIPGQFKIPLKNATSTSKSCIQNSSQSFTWDCTSGVEMQLSIQIVQSGIWVLFNYSGSDGPSDSTLSMVQYGAHPPLLTDPTTMSLMQAKDHMDMGPAYVFHKQFNKLVVLPEGYFDADDQDWPQRRDDSGDPQHYNFSDRKFAQVGEKPWFCFWNGTLLEGFIFVKQPIATDNTVMKRGDAHGFYMEETSAIPGSITPAYNLPMASVTPVTPLSSPCSTSDGSAASASSAATLARADSAATSSALGQESARAASASEAWASRTTSDVSVEMSMKLDDTDLDENLQIPQNRYPTVIKIEERQDLGNQAGPYCQQMQIKDDKSAQPINQMRIDLPVEEFDNFQSRRSKKRGEWLKKRLNLGKRDDHGCACAWLLNRL